MPLLPAVGITGPAAGGHTPPAVTAPAADASMQAGVPEVVASGPTEGASAPAAEASAASAP